MQLALLALLVTLVCEAVREFAGEAKLRALRRRAQDVAKQAAECELLAARMNSPATFASAAKLQRKAIALGQEKQRLHEQEAAIASGWAYAVPKWAGFLTWAACLLLLWGRPAAEVDPDLTWPLTRWLAQPHARKFAGLGVVTALPWLSLSQRASAAVTRALGQLAGEARAAQ